jgi:threonine/homoserine/homoserine lactone efflux protein
VDLPPVPASALARREMLTALGNPKAYLLFTAFLPQFVEPGAALAPQLLTLGALYIAIEGCAAAVWAGAGAWLGGPSLTRARRRLLNRLSGGVMIGAAALLARSERQAA